MHTILKNKWWLDVILFAGFLAAFFLDLTGLALHQWIGLAVGMFALYHLVTHWSWVKAVSARLLGKTSSQARLYYLVDTLMLLGFAGILFTGLAISSWFNLSLANYALWRAVHIIASIETLLALVVKLGLHWRWIVTAARKVFAAPAPAPAQASMLRTNSDNTVALPPARRPVTSGPVLRRREFIKVMGGVGVASLFALSSAYQGLQDSAPAVQADAQSNATTSTATAAPLPAATASVAADASTVTQLNSSACVVRCNRGCSFPGQCRRYTDTNGNNRCDQGECL